MYVLPKQFTVLVSSPKFVFKAQLEVSALGLAVVSVKITGEATQFWGLLELFNTKLLLENFHEDGQEHDLKLIR